MEKDFPFINFECIQFTFHMFPLFFSSWRVCFLKHNGNTTLICFFESISETFEGAPTFYEPVNDFGHLPSPLGQEYVKQLKLPSRVTITIQDYSDLNCVS